MPRVFLSHSSLDNRQAMALKAWLEQSEPSLDGEIFLDLDVDNGIPAGVRWKDALRRANDRCEAVICLVSEHWDGSHECKTEYRTAEDRGKPIFPVRLTPLAGSDITGEWQRCDLYGDGPMTTVTVDGGAEPVQFATAGLMRLRNGLRAAGIAPDSFLWPPEGDPNREPYRGWRPLQAVDAAVYFGRDAQINRALTAIRGLRNTGERKAFVILGPSGAGKSSFLRAGLLPRLHRDDRHFLVSEVVRPERYPLTGEHGLAAAVHRLRAGVGLDQPSLGAIKAGAGDAAQVRAWLAETQAAAQIVDATAAPTLILPVDQAEELFGADAGDEASAFLSVVAGLLGDDEQAIPIVVAATVRADRYELMQTAPQLAGLSAQVFDDLKPLPQSEFRQVICGPAERAEAAGARFRWTPELVERLLKDCSDGADALPLLALTLARLYQDYGGAMVGLAEYDSMGGMRRVVETEIAEVLSADSAERDAQLRLLHDAFIPWLATINPDNDEPMRRIARYADLPIESRPLVDALVARRLLVKDERGGETVVEVALESFLRQWDTLAGWLSAEAADLKNADALENAARAWEHSDRHEDWLLEGTRLGDAESLAAQPGFRQRLNSAREYLLASRQRDDRRAQERQQAAEALAAAEEKAKVEAQQHAQTLLRRTRVLRAALALVAVVALVAVGAGIWAFRSQRLADARARDATAIALNRISEEMFAGLYRPSGADDVDAIQMVLAARSFPSTSQGNDYFLLNALNRERDILKIIDQSNIVTQAVFSPDGRRIASGGFDSQVRQWDSQTGAAVTPPMSGHRHEVRTVAYNPDGTRIASGGMDGTVRVWDAATGKQLGEPIRGHEGPVGSVVFTPDGTRLITGSADSTVRMWDVLHGKPIGEPLRGHTDAVLGVAVSRDGSRIASCSIDQTIRIWDAHTGAPIGQPLRGHDGWVTSVAFSPDGSRVVSGSSDKTVRMWDVTTGKQIGEPLRGHAGAINGVAFSPDGTRIASGSSDSTIRLWDTDTHAQVGILQGHRAAVETVAFSPDGRKVVSASDDATLRVWDAVSWQPMVGATGWVSAAFDDGTTIRTGGADSTVRTWDNATGRQTRPPIRVADTTTTYLLPVGHGQLVSLNPANDVEIWSDTTGAQMFPPTRLPVDIGVRTRFDYTPVTHRMAEQTDAGVLDILTVGSAGPTTSIRQDSPINTYSFSSDGRLIATGSTDWGVRVYDAQSGQRVGGDMRGDGWITNIEFSADGRYVSASDLDNKVRVWDIKTSQPAGPPLESDTTAVTLAVSPDGGTVATGDAEGHIKMWATKTGNEFGNALVGHTQEVNRLVFSADGSRLLSSGYDGTARVWPVPSPSEAALCSKITHNMSREQWKSYVSPDLDYIASCPDLPSAADAG